MRKEKNVSDDDIDEKEKLKMFYKFVDKNASKLYRKKFNTYGNSKRFIIQKSPLSFVVFDDKHDLDLNLLNVNEEVNFF